MTRVPASLVVLLLAREAAEKGRPELAVTATTLRSWRARGHIGPGPGYDLAEIVAYIARRHAKAAA